MPKVSLFVLLPPLIFAGLVLLFLSGMYRDNPDALPSTLVGRAAPTLEVSALPPLPVIDPTQVGQGEVVLVNFWASWCAPCRVEHPQLMGLQDEGLTILGVNYKDTPQKALQFLEDLGDPYAGVGADPDGRTAIDWGVYGVPETFVVGKDGKVVLRFAGPVTEGILESQIRPAIEAASAK